MRGRSFLSRRQFLAIGGLSVAGGLVAACAGPPASPTAAPAASQPTIAAAKPAATAPPQAAAATKLTFAWPFSTTSQTFQDNLAKQFMDQNKSISVEVQIIPQTQAVPKLTTAFTGGDAPDVIALSDGWLTPFAAGGYLANVDQKLKDSGLDQEIAPSILGETRSYKNTAYAAGFLVDVYALYYNKQFFGDAGLAGPPKTTDDFAQDAKKLTDPSKNRYGYYAIGATGWSFQQWSTWMVGAGGPGANNTYFDASGKCVLDGQKFARGLDQWLSLYRVDKVSPQASATAGWQEAGNAFNAGQIGMIMGWMTYISSLSQGIGADKFGVALMPAGPAGQFSYFGGNSYAINAHAKDQDAAWKFVQWLVSPTINSQLSKEWGAIPANTKAWNDDWLKAEHFQVPKEIVQNTKSQIKQPIQLPDWSQFFLIEAPKQIQKALLGQQTAQQVADDVASFLTKANAKASGG